MKMLLKKLAFALILTALAASLCVGALAEGMDVEETSVQTQAPVEEPTAGPTDEPASDVTASPSVEPTSDVTASPSAEPTSEPTSEPTADPTEEPTAEPTSEPSAEPTEAPAKPTAFTGTVEIKLVNTGDIYFGDTVTLRAVVRDANTAYEIRWECNDGNGWVEIEDEDELEYDFVVTEENAKLAYRVVLITEA